MLVELAAANAAFAVIKEAVQNSGGGASSIFYGTANITSIFYGSIAVSAIYYGATQVF